MYFDSESSTFLADLRALQPTPGYCALVDITGSTELKDRGIEHWATAIHKVFAITRSYIPTIKLLKSIGDELMYFVPEAKLLESTYSPLALFSAIAAVARSMQEPPVKAALTFCSSVYDLSFVRDIDDFYGKDIDLTARLLSFSQPGELVMNEPFVERVRSKFMLIGNQEQFSEVTEIAGPEDREIKGFKEPQRVFRLPRKKIHTGGSWYSGG